MYNYGYRYQSQEEHGHAFGADGISFQPPGGSRLPKLARALPRYFSPAQPALVRLTGFSPRSIAKWSQGELPSAKQEKALVEMDRLLDGLARVMEPAQIGR